MQNRRTKIVFEIVNSTSYQDDRGEFLRNAIVIDGLQNFKSCFFLLVVDSGDKFWLMDVYSHENAVPLVSV